MSKHPDKISALKRSCVVLCTDLGLLASVCFAHFIVWRTLRARRKGRVARLKKLRLINGKRQASGGNQVLLPVGVDETGMLRETLRDRSFAIAGSHALHSSGE